MKAICSKGSTIDSCETFEWSRAPNIVNFHNLNNDTVEEATKMRGYLSQ